jgi:branched-chain amino acid aminotransferase
LDRSQRTQIHRGEWNDEPYVIDRRYFRNSPLTDRILAGVTRRSIITLVKEQGWAIEERPVTVDEIVEAARTGALKEAFGMGTAAVVSQIDTIGHEGY